MLTEVFHEGSYSGVLQSVTSGIFFNRQKSSALSDQGGRIRFTDSLGAPRPSRTRGEEEGRLAVLACPRACGGQGGSRRPQQPGPALPATLPGRSPGLRLVLRLLSSATRSLSARVRSAQGGQGGEHGRGRSVSRGSAPVPSGGRDRRTGSCAGPARKGAARLARAGHGCSPSVSKTAPLPAPPLPREEPADRSASRAPSPEPAPPRGGFSRP